MDNPNNLYMPTDFSLHWPKHTPYQNSECLKEENRSPCKRFSRQPSEPQSSATSVWPAIVNNCCNQLFFWAAIFPRHLQELSSVLPNHAQQPSRAAFRLLNIILLLFGVIGIYAYHLGSLVRRQLWKSFVLCRSFWKTQTETKATTLVRSSWLRHQLFNCVQWKFQTCSFSFLVRRCFCFIGLERESTCSAHVNYGVSAID